jgi:hypothetical protein
VPVAGKRKIWPSRDLKIFFVSSNSGRVSSGKADERWSSDGTIIARCTRSGMLVGPGTKRKLRPGRLDPAMCLLQPCGLRAGTLRPAS